MLKCPPRAAPRPLCFLRLSIIDYRYYGGAGQAKYSQWGERQAVERRFFVGAPTSPTRARNTRRQPPPARARRTMRGDDRPPAATALIDEHPPAATSFDAARGGRATQNRTPAHRADSPAPPSARAPPSVVGSRRAARAEKRRSCRACARTLPSGKCCSARPACLRAPFGRVPRFARNVLGDSRRDPEHPHPEADDKPNVYRPANFCPDR